MCLPHVAGSCKGSEAMARGLTRQLCGLDSPMWNGQTMARATALYRPPLCSQGALDAHLHSPSLYASNANALVSLQLFPGMDRRCSERGTGSGSEGLAHRRGAPVCALTECMRGAPVGFQVGGGNRPGTEQLLQPTRMPQCCLWVSLGSRKSTTNQADTGFVSTKSFS